MNGMFHFSLVLVASLFISQAFAGQDLNKCEQSSQAAVQSCEAKASGAEGANASQAAAVPRNTNINTNANASQKVNQDSANRLNQAKDGCEKDKEKCEKDCDEAKRSADRKVQQGQSQKPPCSQAPCPEAKADQPQIEPKKESACIAPIMAIMGKLGSGANDAQNAANGDGKTGGQSGGMPPMPPPPKDDKKEDKPPQTPTLTPDQYACSKDPNAATQSKCTNDMVSKCSKGSGIPSADCEQFTAHYCNAAPSNTTQFSKMIDTTPGQSRPGSGVGSQFCNGVVATNFCQDPARSQCATCQNLRNQNSEACKADPSSCATVTNASCPVAEPPIAAGTTPIGGGGKDVMGGGGSIGGGSGSMGAGSGTGEAYTSGAQAAAKEGSSGGPHLDMALGEGGGSGDDGGDWNSGSEDSFAAKYRKGSGGVNMKAAASEGFRSMASVGPGGETGRVGGPSLFGITTATFQKMCNRNQLKNCNGGRQ